MTTSRRRRRRKTVTRSGRRLLLHIFIFRCSEPRYGLRTTVLIRSRRNHVELLPEAYAEARRTDTAAMIVGINTVPAPRATPALDRICQRHTAFRSFLALLTAAGGYCPSIRLDLTGREGLVLARAYDKRQRAWNDSRRAVVFGRPSDTPARA